ncbi:amidohydrolase family protein [Arenimonas sp. MALMAid1274]|uniref:amidohydrolase family protein n=1 Tax=Arenimonas sp. MALMAid1274 TaxID=3411630 RepID=UPI003BA2D6B4
MKLPTLLTALLLALPGLASARDYTWADAHLHYVDFFQETDGMPALLRSMDAGGVRSAVLMGMPVAKKWHEDAPKRPRYYQGDDSPLYWYSATDAFVAEAVLALPEDQRARFHPFLSGFNPADKNATTHIEGMIRLYPGLWQGIGEVLTRHDDLTALIQGDVPRANNEAMMRVYALAAKHDLPVLLHSNLTSVREREPLYLEELQQALSRHPDTRFIWAHAGTSAEIHRTQGELDFLHETLSRLLREHENLWIDLSWTVLEPYLLDKDGKPDAEWLALVGKYPTRFLLGSDHVGHFDGAADKLEAFTPFLDALPEDVAQGLAHRNLQGVLPRRGARPPDRD